MAFQIEGKLHKKFDTEKKTETFQARDFVIEVNEGQYPQVIKFQLTQDKCGLIDEFEEGTLLNVHFDLRGREWNGKYFTNLNAWRIEAADAGSEATSQPTAGAQPPPREAGDPGFDDDLPFARPAALDGLCFGYDGAWFGNGPQRPYRGG